MMKGVYYYIIISIIIGCTSKPTKEEKEASSLILGKWGVISDNKKQTSQSTFDTIAFKNNIYVDGLIFSKSLVDSLLKSKDTIVETRDFQLIKLSVSKKSWLNREYDFMNVFIQNHPSSFYLSTIYMKSVGFIIKDYSHSLMALQMIKMDRDSFDIDELTVDLMADTILYPPPPLPPPAPPAPNDNE